MLIKLYEKNTSEKELERIVDVLENNGVIIYPTDSVYAFACSSRSVKGIEELRRLKDKDSTRFSLVFASLAQVAEYCRVDNATFKILKRNLPGPFTFLLTASSRTPNRALSKRNVIGVRIPSNAIARSIVERLGEPLITTSVRDDDDATEYLTDPELVFERYGNDVDIVIDGGYGDTFATTVVDLTDGGVEIVREGREELR